MKQIDISTVQMGSDAEVFLKDRTGRPFPACGIIPGTKEAPHKLSDDGCAVQVDNVMLEFNTPVSSTRGDWVDNLRRAYRLSTGIIPPTLMAAVEPTMRFDRALLDNQQAQTFGCEPDFNAWTMEQNPRPFSDDATLRSAAAHVHLSWADPDDMMQRCRVIQFADIFVTLPSLNESSDRERRKLYGKAGAFRPKEYGVEHRVMDNYWIDQTTKYPGKIWDRYIEALVAANTPFEISPALAEKVQDIINTYKIEEGLKLYRELFESILPRKAKDVLEKSKGYRFSSALAGLAKDFAADAPNLDPVPVWLNAAIQDQAPAGEGRAN